MPPTLRRRSHAASHRPAHCARLASLVRGVTTRRMEIRLLGPLEVRDGERSIALPRRQQRALLAVLALRAGEVVSTDRLDRRPLGRVGAAVGARLAPEHGLGAAQAARARRSSSRSRPATASRSTRTRRRHTASRASSAKPRGAEPAERARLLRRGARALARARARRPRRRAVRPAPRLARLDELRVDRPGGA